MAAKEIELLLRNYTPVSLMNVDCKILEKIIRNHMDDYLHRRDYPSERQQGLREGRPNVTILLNFYEKVSSILNKRDS